jgi:stress response protein YsnF
VRREKARVVTEPVTDANRDQALSGEELTEGGHEVILTEERPVVTKQTVPVERVRLETDVVADTERVEETVGRERIDVEGVADPDIRTEGGEPRG